MKMMKSSVLLSTLFWGIPSTLASSAASPVVITGYIYCDNYFEFWFNGKLIAKDPLFFTPHNAVRVQFEWDERSNKTYSILCQDFATPSGYEYVFGENFTGIPPWIGDGALVAAFSDGTVTNQDWKVWVETRGPTEASVATGGCNYTNLDACVVESNKAPDDWFEPTFDASNWSSAVEYTKEEAGWDVQPTYGLPQCGKATNPFTRVEMGPVEGFAFNYADYVPTLDNPWTYDPDQVPTRVTLTVDECLDPQMIFNSSMTTNLFADHNFDVGGDATFIWGDNLKLDNRVLFRLDVGAPGDSTEPGNDDGSGAQRSAAPVNTEVPSSSYILSFLLFVSATTTTII